MGGSADLMSPELQCSQGVDGGINPPLHVFRRPARGSQGFYRIIACKRTAWESPCTHAFADNQDFRSL